MAEPLNPAVLGVASALKSLRTRTGLREERLRGTEVLLDTLTGLDSVRVVVNAGQSPERAVVHAVCAAAGTLEPTMSIVADASLGLRLFADQVPDGDLYAEDLTQRRKALLRNWDRLHELRSVRPGKPPSPRALRLEVESEALTALAVALTAGASSGEPAQDHEPQPDGSAISPEGLRVFGADLFQINTRLPIAHGFTDGRFEQAQVLKTSRREDQTLRLASEVRTHHTLAQTGQQQNLQRLLDIFIAIYKTETAGRIGQNREPPSCADDRRIHLRALRS